MSQHKVIFEWTCTTEQLKQLIQASHDYTPFQLMASGVCIDSIIAQVPDTFIDSKEVVARGFVTDVHIPRKG